jgi:hypothetical protein
VVSQAFHGANHGLALAGPQIFEREAERRADVPEDIKPPCGCVYLRPLVVSNTKNLSLGVIQLSRLSQGVPRPQTDRRTPISDGFDGFHETL